MRRFVADSTHSRLRDFRVAQSLTLAFPLLYTVFVLGVCGYLLARGISHAFVILFAIGAVLHAIPTLAIVLLKEAPGGIGENMWWISLFSVFGIVGTFVSAAAFLSLAGYLRSGPVEA